MYILYPQKFIKSATVFNQRGSFTVAYCNRTYQDLSGLWEMDVLDNVVFLVSSSSEGLRLAYQAYWACQAF